MHTVEKFKAAADGSNQVKLVGVDGFADYEDMEDARAYRVREDGTFYRREMTTVHGALLTDSDTGKIHLVDFGFVGLADATKVWTITEDPERSVMLQFDATCRDDFIARIHEMSDNGCIFGSFTVAGDTDDSDLQLVRAEDCESATDQIKDRATDSIAEFKSDHRPRMS